MGMTLYYIRISPQTLDNYLQDSDLFRQDYFTDKDVKEATNVYNIDKSWDGIIYLLTGKNSSDSSEPLSQLIFSNQLIDAEQNLGTGPAHYLLPEAVQQLHAKIKDISRQQLKLRFNAEHMKALGIYPNNVWDEEEVDDYLIEYFETMQEIFSIAAERGEAVITFMQ